MKAVTIGKIGGELVVTELPVPEPADDQILVKVIYAAVNPVDGMTIGMGLLVEGYPFVPGSDVGGIVVKAGTSALSPSGVLFKVGDRVCGCTGVGRTKFGTFQEQALMVARLTLPLPDNTTLAQAATVGVGAYTASLALFGSLNIALPDVKDNSTTKDEWVFVLGGASNVGKMAVQILKFCGYKVVVTASPRSNEILKGLGVDAVIDYKQADEAVIDEVLRITEGQLYRVFDAAAQNHRFAAPIFKAVDGHATQKWFTSTNDWEPLVPDGYTYIPVELGPIGRPEQVALNDQVARYLPFVANVLAQGRIQPAEYVEVGGTGVESVSDAIAYQASGKGGNKKVIVKIQQELIVLDRDG